MYPRRPYTLIINSWNSRCGHCGLGADPGEERHDTTLGYFGRGVIKPEPCHQRFVLVTSDYGGLDRERRLQRMRPDLTWVE